MKWTCRCGVSRSLAGTVASEGKKICSSCGEPRKPVRPKAG